jgi:hypothetical protein
MFYKTSTAQQSEEGIQRENRSSYHMGMKPIIVSEHGRFQNI